MLRVLAIVLLLTAAWGGLMARMLVLHLGPTDALRARIESIRKSEETLLVERGRILDRNGNILALNTAAKNVCVDPAVILSNRQELAIGHLLARVLQLDPAIVLARLARPDRRYERIQQFVPEELAQRIQRMQLRGVWFEDTTVRHYPQAATMCHVLGFANLEGVGSAGIEQKFESYLRGSPGLRISERDGRRREIFRRRSLDIAPQEGCDVFLTLDQTAQYIVEKELDAAMVEHGARAAWAIVMHVRTGEILAMASRPEYDLNAFRSADPDALLNRAIGSVFEPGSTFKVAIIAAALNEGSVTPERIFDCERGLWMFQGRPLRDYHPAGELSVADILKKSSNIGAAKVALTLDRGVLEQYLRAFGFGRPTGIQLPGEEAGILRPAARWTPLSVSRIAMGHEVAVTSLQMLCLMACVANEGRLLRPSVILRVVEPRGQTLAQFSPMEVGRPIRPETARLMSRLLMRGTEPGGTGTRARVEGYTVAGKTGTAQKAIPGGYSDSANVASFMGFLPAEDPELALIVVVDEPQPLHTGGLVAAPVFSRIADQLVRYLNVPSSVAAREGAIGGS